MSCVSFLLVVTLAWVTVDVERFSGERISGQLRSLSNDGISLRLQPDDELTSITQSDLRAIQFRTQSAPVGSVLVQLVDGSSIYCDQVTLREGRLAAMTGEDKWSAPADAVRAVRWGSAAASDEWSQLLQQTGSEDLLILGRSASLDYLKGIVSGITGDAVMFEYDGSTIPVPLTKTDGFILGRQLGGEPAAPRVRLSARDGSQWHLASIELKSPNHFSMTTVSGVDRLLSVDDVARIEFRQLNAIPLSDLEPQTVVYQPFFGTRLHDAISKLRAPQFDRSRDGQLLRLADPGQPGGLRHFERGVVIQSHTELVYRLAGKYQRFLTTAGVDPAADSLADIELILYGDDQEIDRWTIAKSTSSVEVDADVRNVRRLRLVVGYGQNIHIGDRLILGNARLTK